MTKPKHYQIEYIDPKILKPAEYNPRTSNTSQESNLQTSLKEHGFIDPVIVNKAKNRENIIIGGHFRVRMAIEAGLKTVPVIYVNIPEIEQEKKLNLRLNRVSGDWDDDLLRDFDLEILEDTGFDALDFERIWDDMLGIEAEENTERSIKEILEDKPTPRMQPGQIYQLGEHRLMCGDSTNAEQASQLVHGQNMQMVYCDPPYQIGLSYDKGISGKRSYGGQESDNRTEKDYELLLKETMQNALSTCANDAHIFYWCDQNYVGLVQKLYQELSISPERVCLWVKNNLNATPKIAFNKMYEPCVYGKIGNPAIYMPHNLSEILNQDIDTGNRALEQIQDIFDIWLVRRIPSNEYNHPTQKPVTLHEKPLRRCTKVGDNVLDLFGGSGSTLRACEQMKRRAFLMEKDPVFCEVILILWEEMTGQKAVLLSGTEENIEIENQASIFPPSNDISNPTLSCQK